jgi:hypothetical protein
MKPFSHLPAKTRLAFIATFLSLASASLATQTRTNAPASVSPAATNAGPAQVEIPKSVFLVPSTPQEGKDPFFPRSMRLYASAGVKTNVQPTAPSFELRLNGISGTADHRLAIINNQTFQANEEGEVPTNPGHARIRCLEIKPDSVLVEVGGQQRALRLRPGI